MIAGPVAITATLLLAGRTAGDPLQLIALIAIAIAIAAICGGTFALAGRVAGALGLHRQHRIVATAWRRIGRPRRPVCH